MIVYKSLETNLNSVLWLEARWLYWRENCIKWILALPQPLSVASVSRVLFPFLPFVQARHLTQEWWSTCVWVWQIVLDWLPLITKGSCLSIREMCQVCVLAGCAGWLVGHGEAPLRSALNFNCKATLVNFQVLWISRCKQMLCFLGPWLLLFYV